MRQESLQVQAGMRVTSSLPATALLTFAKLNDRQLVRQ